MRLKTLRLHGFKSFADRTALDFREGVTAIVGSNGCGKSNIADAVRWVLGEQRPSAIRGAKMEEVIFQGTARRRPLNFAEVSLHFDNESGRVPIPQTELEVTRKVFREGGSEYALNRASCRLRDIQGLLRDTGLGSNAYAIIEATMIETLLSDRADERRTLFEEAAGIGKYKDSRQAAMRRLDAADADLTRLDDLIAEVESKVRTLARQKRRAERHRELQSRRLALEVAIARAELAELEASLASASAERKHLDEIERIAGAERAAAEAIIEERRIEASELGRRRTARSGQLEAVRTRLDEREREILVSEERRTHGEFRMKQLADERSAIESGWDAMEAEVAARASDCRRLAAAVVEARRRADERAGANHELRSVLTAERAATDAVAEAARKLAREIATTEGERMGAERRGREARDRLAELRDELERVRLELNQMTGQTELWEIQADEVRSRLVVADEALDTAREELTVLRGREHRAREELRAADDRLATLTAQIEARDALERSYEGFSPAVSAIMAQRDDFPGVHGPLADFVQETDSPDRAGGVEAYLGPLLQALVVDDLATARALRNWFRGEWTEGGSLLLLPLDAVGAVADGPERSTAGTPWVKLLLTDLIVVGDDPLAEFRPGVTKVGPEGEIVDGRGVIRLVERGEGQGILARREGLTRLRREQRSAQRQREARLHERDELRDTLGVAEDRLVEAEEAKRVAESRLKGIELDAAAHLGRHSRLSQDRDSLEASVAALEVTAEEAAGDLIRVEGRLSELARDVQSTGEAEIAAREKLAELERAWDEARDEEAEVRVALARAESEFREADRLRMTAEERRAAASARKSAIEVEATNVRSTLESLSGLRENATGEVEALFTERDGHTGELALLDARLAEVDSELAELGERARAARRAESEATEGRHQTDLRIADLRSRCERVRDRLEAEWGRPWANLTSESVGIDEGDIEAWRTELRETSETLDGLGPVNMLAVEEHGEEARRLDFLIGQRNDLVAARDNLVAAIRQINRTAREVFQSTFDAVRMNFRRTFQSLFHGGECDIWLADPDDPLESAVEIQASPLGKRTQRIHLLSGGERTLTALALLFALYLVKPSPFCILDEVDAPLDETNVGRFLQLLHDFKHETQFIVITHNPRTMEAADWVYGVTMEDPGVSSIVGVELLGAWTMDGVAAIGDGA
jgi:chromosome segregation protein